MRWLTEHLRHLADQGRTVLVSSYALGEAEQIADHVLEPGSRGGWLADVWPL